MSVLDDYNYCPDMDDECYEEWASKLNEKVDVTYSELNEKLDEEFQFGKMVGEGTVINPLKIFGYKLIGFGAGVVTSLGVIAFRKIVNAIKERRNEFKKEKSQTEES